MGKFVLGFLVGTAVGVGAALILSTRPRSDEGLIAAIQTNLQAIVDEAKHAASRREQELWQEFYSRVPQAQPAIKVQPIIQD
ncbi:MAG: hypothetical protein KatS3mg057_0537 [Herpetosiphonaceae bacterium]|nr:MAG: hypothetical protein KatS3mg057_0537 [Herpetosiphonaceae bacterium]